MPVPLGDAWDDADDAAAAHGGGLTEVDGGAAAGGAAVAPAASSKQQRRKERASRSSSTNRPVLRMGAASVSNVGGQPFRPSSFASASSSSTSSSSSSSTSSSASFHGSGGGNSRASGGGGFYGGGAVAPGLVDAMHIPRDRLLVFKMEKNLTKFMAKKSARTMKFPPLAANARRLLHLMCERFCVRSETIEPSLEQHLHGDPRAPRPMMIIKDHHSILPERQLIEMYGREASSGTGARPKIMMRKRDPAGRNGLCAAGQKPKAVSGVGKQTKEELLREKERKYAEARRRILGGSGGGGNGSANNNQTLATSPTTTEKSAPTATSALTSSSSTTATVTSPPPAAAMTPLPPTTITTATISTLPPSEKESGQGSSSANGAQQHVRAAPQDKSDNAGGTLAGPTQTNNRQLSQTQDHQKRHTDGAATSVMSTARNGLPSGGGGGGGGGGGSGGGPPPPRPPQTDTVSSLGARTSADQKMITDAIGREEGSRPLRETDVNAAAAVLVAPPPDVGGLSLNSFESISSNNDNEKKTALHTWRKESAPSNFRSVDGDAHDPDFIRGFLPPQGMHHPGNMMMPVGMPPSMPMPVHHQGMASPFQMGQMMGPGFGAFSSWAVTPQQQFAGMPFQGMPGQSMGYPGMQPHHQHQPQHQLPLHQRQLQQQHHRG
jgi:hypothetical protein